MTDHRSASRSALQRLLGRLRHGLLLQELLDRLARAGIVVYPYVVTSNRYSGEDSVPLPPGYSVRVLGAADAEVLARLAFRPRSVQEVRSALANAVAYGAFHRGELIGHIWARFDVLPVPTAAHEHLRELRPDELYAFDVYVAPEHRGARLALALSRYARAELARQGRTHTYGMTLAFNRSSRQFQRRGTGRETELRLYLHVRLGRLPGLDFRLRRRVADPQTPPFRRVAHARPAGTRA